MAWTGFARTRLGRWYLEEHGAARRPGDPAVVLLHGLMLDRRMWAPQIPQLGELGRVLAIDGPGHGLSEVPGPFTLDDQADALADALDDAGAPRALLVGHSWGGLAALRLALRHPERVAAMAIVDAGAGPEPRLRRLRYHLCLEYLRRHGAPRWFVRAELARLVYGARARRQRPALVADLHRRINGQPRQGLVRAARAVVDRDGVADRLWEIRVPVLVACGQDDHTMEPARSEELARRIAGARLVWMPCGHTPPEERPDDFSAALMPFVRRHLSIQVEGAGADCDRDRSSATA